MDLMLIGAAQKVEHYEVSGYGTVRAIAEAIGNDEVASLLRQTEEEEAETDRKLTQIASRIIEEANGASEEEDDEDSDEDNSEEGDEDDEEVEDEDQAAPPPPAKKAAPKKR